MGLRTRARIPQSQLTDQELRKLFSAIDYTNDGSVQAQEFVDFMGLNAKDYEADDAAAAAAVAEAASYRPVVARLRDFYRQKRPDKLAVGLTAIHGQLPPHFLFVCPSCDFDAITFQMPCLEENLTVCAVCLAQPKSFAAAHEDREMELVHKLVNRFGAEARTFFVQFLPVRDASTC